MKYNLTNWKHKLIVHRGCKCEECGQGNIWNDKFIRHEIDHIDGNHKNNVDSNLRVLCPNCHSQTGTFSEKKYSSYREIKHSHLEENANSINSLIDICRIFNLNYRNPLCMSYIKELLSTYYKDHPNLLKLHDLYILGRVQTKRISKYEHLRPINANKGKYISREDYMVHKKLENDIENEVKVRAILESRIDFSKFGWVQKASVIIGITPQRVGNWMNRFMHDFYNTKCQKRKVSDRINI